MNQQYIKELDEDKKVIVLHDHCGGFDKFYKNTILDQLYTKHKGYEIVYHNILDEKVKEVYPDFNFKFSSRLQEYKNFKQLKKYKGNHRIEVNNFICTLLGSLHVSRMLLASILHKSQLWNNEYCTKNFEYNWNSVDGAIAYYTENKEHVYNRFFIDYHSDIDKKITSIDYTHSETMHNMSVVEPLIINSGLTIVAECVGESYVPFVTEKFLQNIVTKTLFLGYAQPGWHNTLSKQYGFKLYNCIFDYSFDEIKNPVYRLLRLIEMISKFRYFTKNDWQEIYLAEQETLEFNYDHYFSNDYLKCIDKYSDA